MSDKEARTAVASDTAVPADVAADCFLALANRLTAIRDQCVQFHALLPAYTDSDFRKTVFVKIAALHDATALALRFMGKCLMDKQWWRSNSGIVSISPEASEGGIIPHVDTFLVLVRSGFTHLAFSQLETTLREFL